MNSLSWLIYGAEVFDNLRSASAGFLFIGGMCVVLSPMAFMIADLGPDDAMRWYGKHWGKMAAIAAAAAVIFLIATPSKTTIMLIAASELGETVLASSEAQKIGGEAGALATDSLRVLRKFINEQLDEKSE